ncbi:hypothetical protein [Phenylobacterium sp.]|uniref:hypothetical protein n=1 Tax=Phenylobacterium sp. TaxID=1871053 RepID=UPI0030F3D2E7
MKVFALLSLLALAACASAPREPVVKVVEVKVAVPVTCAPKTLGAAPVYPDTDAAVRASPGPGDLLQLLAAGRLLRDQRLAEIEPVIAACR